MIQPVDNSAAARPPRRLAVLKIVGALAGILFLGQAIYTLTRGDGDKGPPADDGISALLFSGPEWRAAPMAAPTQALDPNLAQPLRLRMVDDLLQSDRLDDVTMNEAARIVGTPDATRPEGEGEPAPIYGPAWGPMVSQRWFFRLGPKRSSPGPTEDLEWLILDFEQGGYIVSRTLHVD